MNRRFGTVAVLACLIAGAFSFSSCHEPAAPPDPHVITDEEILRIAADALSESSGGVRVQLLDFLTVAQGKELTSERKDDGSTQPVTRSGSRTIDGAQHAYNYAVDYTYIYSGNGCGSPTSMMGPSTACIWYGFRTHGAHGSSHSTGNDSSFTPDAGSGLGRWNVFLKDVPGRYSFSAQKFSRSGSVTLKESGKSFSYRLKLTFLKVLVDPATAALSSQFPFKEATPTQISTFDLDNVKASDGFAIGKPDGSPFHGEIYFKEDNTAIIRIVPQGTSTFATYSLDMITGEVKKL